MVCMRAKWFFVNNDGTRAMRDGSNPQGEMRLSKAEVDGCSSPLCLFGGDPTRMGLRVSICCFMSACAYVCEA